ncbi:hypothetical protein C0Q70_07101 [Pomacea canaliculata]|uniref:sn-1-specific diacylglycerol lipase ABHD11 n=1 Tax=Pomacea canaliculata TaxID=400727 RepID=A0A2T7PE35_POMCA|nr:hypothetical protein C0Q70_07101 [Pomacea canaliculata]
MYRCFDEADIITGKVKSEIVVTLDARNHGESGHDPKINYLLMRDDLLRMMDAMGVEKAILLGHSMGGKTVMCFALSKPERVSSLIVVDTAPVISPGGKMFKLYAEEMKNADISSISSLTEARNKVGNALKAVVSDVGIQQFLLTNLTQSENKTIAWRVNLDAIIDNVDDICSFPEFASTYDRKVLFIGGSDSEHIHESAKPIIRKLFPTAAIEYISNAGHWVHADKPEEFLQKVKEFIHSTHGES